MLQKSTCYSCSNMGRFKKNVDPSLLKKTLVEIEKVLKTLQQRKNLICNYIFFERIGPNV